MRVKKYIVNSMPDAMQKIKHDLGQNAIILNTKKIKTGGFLGFFTRDQIEVIAAIDQEKKAKLTSNQPADVPHSLHPKEALGSRDSTGATNGSFLPPKKATSDNTLNHELMGEMRDIKKFMQMMLSEKEEKIPAPLQKLNELFIKQEISNEIRIELMSRLMLKVKEEPDVSHEKLLEWAKEEFLSYLRSLPNKAKDQDFAKIVCFIGPTGVGKTTTIAKLAADLMLKHKKKIGFITADTYRIAAVEQLKTYATILNIPIEVVFSPEDLQPALENLSACDTILMDTAGRNYLQKRYIEELEQLIPKEEGIQTNLVLSLTTKYEDLSKIIENFNQIEVDRLILTKLDETRSYGTIINILYNNSFPLTYMTNGQNVPDDIVVATPELIIDLILGEDTHERSS
jgi:flagellar biosynthesis protein FlhF